MKLPGFDRATAESVMSAGTIKGQLDKKKEVESADASKTIFNPFEKKES